jgi:hypothetical protein
MGCESALTSLRTGERRQGKRGAHPRARYARHADGGGNGRRLCFSVRRDLADGGGAATRRYGSDSWIWVGRASGFYQQREYLADAAAVEFTRNPVALIRALEHIARIESPLKAALRGVAPLFIVDPFECGGTSWAEYLDEVARIESQQDKIKQQRDTEVVQYMAKGMPENLFQNALSSHLPIHDRSMDWRPASALK